MHEDRLQGESAAIRVDRTVARFLDCGWRSAPRERRASRDIGLRGVERSAKRTSPADLERDARGHARVTCCHPGWRRTRIDEPRMIATGPAGGRSPTVTDTAGPDDVARLLEFLHGRDAPCPLCGYNLRDLTRPECPECHHELLLTVGITRPNFLWFLLAVIPCAFAGIAASLLLIPMTLQTVMGGGFPPPPLFALDALGWLSAAGGLVLVRHRFAFLRQSPKRQRILATAVWAANVLALLAFLGVMASL